MWRLCRWWSLKLQLSCPRTGTLARHRAATRASPQIHMEFLKALRSYMLLSWQKKKKNKQTCIMKWKDKSTVTEAQPFNHCSQLTSSAHTEQSSCTAQPVVRSQNSDHSSTSCASLTQLCTPEVLQHRTQQTENKQVLMEDWEQLAKMNMKMYYVAWQ